MKKTNVFLSLLFLLIFIAAPGSACAEDKYDLSSGQFLYVPAYSHIYYGSKENQFFLTVTLSIRNIDPKNEITITKVDYHETDGYRLTRYLHEPYKLAPMGSMRYVVAENDKTGGSGANFLVEWEAEKPVNSPVVESIMIGTYSQQGISFTSRARVIVQEE